MQVDELYKICGVLGSPTPATWPEGLQLAAAMGFTFPSFAPIPLHQLVTPLAAMPLKPVCKARQPIGRVAAGGMWAYVKHAAVGCLMQRKLEARGPGHG